MSACKIKDALRGERIGQRVTVSGWVRTRRDSKGGFSFLELNDGSAFDNLQVVAPNTLPNYTMDVLRLTTGASVAVTGTLVASSGGKQAVEIQASGVEVVGLADAETYPLQKQKTSLEHLRTIAHLRPRTNTFGAVARVRSVAALAVHQFFQSRGFVWVPAPIITASDCEGAGAMFQVTTLDLDKPARTPDGAVNYAEDFFGRRAYLTVSGQLEAETHACALGDVYTFGPTFRAENSNTPRHLAEFWMIEPEMAFADLARDMEVAEAFVKHVIAAVLTGCAADLAFFEQRVQAGLTEMLKGVVASEFVKLSYSEAVKHLEASGKTWEFPVAWGSDLQTEHERYLTEELCKRPVIVTDYPRQIKAFYMRLNDDNTTVRAMDVLVPRMGEIIGGSQREERLELLERRMRDAGLSPENYWWYLDLRRFGSVPHAGFGLGFERLLQFMTGLANIRDVIPFPRTPKSADF